MTEIDDERDIEQALVATANPHPSPVLYSAAHRCAFVLERRYEICSDDAVAISAGLPRVNRRATVLPAPASGEFDDLLRLCSFNSLFKHASFSRLLDPEMLMPGVVNNS